MAKETELERLVVRLIGDAEQYKRMIDESKRATKDAANSVVRAGKRIEGVQQTIKGLGRRFSQAGMAMKSFGKKISLYVTAPLTAMGGLATRESVKFSDSLAKIRGLVGLSSEAVQGFRKDILSLATEVGKAPEELSEAMFFITSAGLRGDAALEALTVSAKAAASGMGQTKSVADAVTNAMNAYGQETMSATRSTEILTAAIRAGKADAASFAPQLGQLLPMANHLGVGFDEVAGSIAFLTKTTGNASLAATQYKGILRALVKPPKEVRKRLEELAKSTGDVSLSLEGIQETIRTKGLFPALLQLKKALAANGIEMGQFFTDSEGFVGALQMTGPAAKDAAQVLDDVANSAGIVADAYGESSKEAGHQFRQAMAASRVVMIELGDIVAPIMQKITSMTVDLMDVWRMMPKELKKIGIGIAAGVAVIGPVIVGLGTAISLVGGAITTLGGVIGFVFSGPGALIVAATAAVTAFTAVLGKMVYDAMETTGTLDELKEDFMAVGNSIQKSLGDIGGAIQKGKLKEAVQILTIDMKIGFLKFVDWMKYDLPQMLMKTLKSLATKLASLGSNLKEVITGEMSASTYAAQIALSVSNTLDDRQRNRLIKDLEEERDKIVNDMKPLPPLPTLGPESTDGKKKSEGQASAAKGIVDGAKGVLEGILGTATGIASRMRNDFLERGKNIIEWNRKTGSPTPPRESLRLTENRPLDLSTPEGMRRVMEYQRNVIGGKAGEKGPQEETRDGVLNILAIAEDLYRSWDEGRREMEAAELEGA